MHTRLRRAMLDGNWLSYLEQARDRHFGPSRAAGHGPADQSACPFRVIQRELAQVHHAPPIIRHGNAPEDGGAIAGVVEAIDRSGLWPAMRRFDQWVLGCNEYLLRVHVDASGRVYYRPVAPDLVEADPHPDEPSRPIAIRERRLRKHPKKDEDVWTLETVSIADPAAPVYTIHEIREDGKIGADWTATLLEKEQSGDDYWYRRADATPVLPYVLYHKERLGDRLWDPYEGIETVQGSITLAVMLSFWVHCMRDASWPQRWVANAEPQSLEATDEGNAAARRVSEVDPAILVVLQAMEAGNQIMVGQWQPGADPKMLLEAIDAYAARLATDAGLSPSDIQRASSSARSGYAIAMTNDGKRQAQKRYYEQFRAADEELVALTAILLNRATGSDYPEDGYTVVYREIPLSPDELRERRANVIELIREGLMDPADGYRELNPGLTTAQARADLERIRQERARLSSAPAEPPPQGDEPPADAPTAEAPE